MESSKLWHALLQGYFSSLLPSAQLDLCSEVHRAWNTDCSCYFPFCLCSQCFLMLELPPSWFPWHAPHPSKPISLFNNDYSSSFLIDVPSCIPTILMSYRKSLSSYIVIFPLNPCIPPLTESFMRSMTMSHILFNHYQGITSFFLSNTQSSNFSDWLIHFNSTLIYVEFKDCP